MLVQRERACTKSTTHVPVPTAAMPTGQARTHVPSYRYLELSHSAHVFPSGAAVLQNGISMPLSAVVVMALVAVVPVSVEVVGACGVEAKPVVVVLA